MPVRAPAGEPCLDPKQTLEALRPVLENPDDCENRSESEVRHDRVAPRRSGTLPALQFDTMVASYLLDAGERNHNLDDLASRYLNHTTTKIEALIGSGKNSKADGRGAGGRDHALRRRRCRRGVASDAAAWRRD